MAEIPTPDPEPPVPLRFRLLFLGFSLALSFGVAELLIRKLDGGALPHLSIFAEDPNRGIILRAGATDRVRRADGVPFTVETDETGLRRSSTPARDWLVVGDSQVLGWGVSAEDSFAGRLGLRNAGVPGYGLPDALRDAEQRCRQPGIRAILVIVNQANDWEEAELPVEDRFHVNGGWLIRRRAETRSRLELWWSSPLPHFHVLYLASMLLTLDAPGAATLPAEAPPAWMQDPAGQAPLSAKLAHRINAFAALHPDIRVVTAFLPVDVATGEARVAASPFGPAARAVPHPPWSDSSLYDQVRAALHGPLLDLRPALSKHPEAFQERDYHLSAEGHRLVAQALETELSP